MSRKMIEGKHLPEVVTIDRKTGEKKGTGVKPMMLPAKEGTCQECAVAHDPTLPHNAQSMFYQYKFFNEYGRWPNWNDAMSHCDTEMKNQWIIHLKKMGVDVEGGKVNPAARGEK